MKRHTRAAQNSLGIAMLAACFIVGPAYAQGTITQVADVGIQGDPSTPLAEDGAVLKRMKNGIVASLAMPTPAPGSYDYPNPVKCPGPPAPSPTAFAGFPEVFTGWAFTFNHPELCSPAMEGGPPVCDGNDVGHTPAGGAAYNYAGHVVGGPQLQLVGAVSVGETPFGGDAHAPLTNPTGAEVHLAVAPHGQLNANGALDTPGMPTQINTPAGCPPLWWVAIFRAP